MGMIEEARVNLARGKKAAGDKDLLTAQVQASIAIAESLDEVQRLLSVLVDKLDQVDSAVMGIWNQQQG